MSNWLLMPPWSAYAVAAALVVVVATLALRAMREQATTTLPRQWLSIALRALVIALLLLIALNPTLIQSRPQANKPRLTVLMDTSASMAVADVAGKPRLTAATSRMLDPKVRAMLDEHFDVEIHRFDRDSEPIAWDALAQADAAGRGSDLGAAVTLAVTDQADRESRAGVLLISDGQPTQGNAADAARLALARSVPLWTWTLGGVIPRRDLWLDAPATDVLAFSDDSIDIEAALHQVGYEHRSFNVEVVRDGAVLQTIEATPRDGEPAVVRATVQAPKEGEMRVTLRVAPGDGEADTSNNELPVFVRAVGRKVRVLVAEGQPHWDTKFLVQCLKRSPRVDVTAIYRLGDGKQFAVVSSEGQQRREAGDLFPRSIDQFAAYDVVVLGRGCEAFFDDQTAPLLSEFVSRHGGSLVFGRGRSYGGRYAPLSKLEPVVWGEGGEAGVRLVMAERAATAADFGELSRVVDLGASGAEQTLLEQLPRFDRVQQTMGVKPLAVVLARGEGETITVRQDSPQAATADDSPVVMAYQPFGQGRVVTVNAAGLWRWSFGRGPEEHAQAVYERFWMGLMRWLLSGSDFGVGQDVALRSDRRLYSDEQRVELLVRTRGIDHDAYRPRLIIDGPDQHIELEPQRTHGGTFRAVAGPFAPGAYQLTLQSNIGEPGTLTTAVSVVSGSIENRQLSADPQLMAQLAEMSGGRVIASADVMQLPGIVRRWQVEQELAEERTMLWDRWWVLALIVVLLGAEWYRRRREGLL